MSDEREWWQEQGYLYGRQLDRALYPDVWVCVAEMIFTWRLMLCTTDSVLEFWCYPKDGSISLAPVLEAAARWDGQGDPPDGWVKHHPSGRRR